jgi:ATP-dependent helicase HrpB
MQSQVQAPLPIDPHIAAISEHVRRERSAVIVAPPGSGKTTRVPPALARLGRTILLQPRRVAARALARRIASEQGWTIGGEIGWQIRFERRFSRDTRLLVATEGILTARLQSDPLLTDFDVVILDEFHERSIHADLALALVRQAMQSRDDLAVVVMSATIDPAPVASFLGGARVFSIDARPYPVDVRYRPGMSVAEAVRETTGNVLCFLPGAREIEQARVAIGNLDALVLPLHGQLDVDAQERALAPALRRKVILATNVAETSLTVEGVTEVIDSGLQKVMRYDAESGIDHLVTERVSLDSADQRAGRAGRTAPGRATRLWDARDILRPQREPEINRVDLASTMLDVIAWGGDPLSFEWFERPATDRLDAALELLTQLGAIEGRKLTAIGEELRRYPLHPRLARLIVAAEGDETAVRIAAAISEGVRLRRSETTVSDALALADDAPPHVVAQLLRHPERSRGTRADGGAASAAMSSAPAARPGPSTTLGMTSVLKAILAAYPDRVARRREPRSPRLLLASGTGAVLAKESGVRDGEYLVAFDVANTGGEALVRAASIIEKEWLTPTRIEKVHMLTRGRVRAVEHLWYGALLLGERSAEADPLEEARLLEEDRKPKVDPLTQRRIAFAGTEKNLDKLAPLTIPLPSGRGARLEYRDDGSVFASVKLQELFGLGETPRIGPNQTSVTFELLAPNGRPVQVTRDLRSFWNNTYAEVRKELRGRYPRHPWPDDPWNATPTHRTKRRV